MSDFLAGYQIGREMERQERELERLRSGEWADAAAVTELAEQIAANRVAIEALNAPAADEVIAEADAEIEEPGEEVIAEILGEEGEPEGSEIEQEIAEETAAILDDVADAIDEVSPDRNHILTRRIIG